MKEVSQLLKDLKKYPPNSFVCPGNTYYPNSKMVHKTGLNVIDLEGNVLGFIETGTDDGNVIIN